MCLRHISEDQANKPFLNDEGLHILLISGYLSNTDGATLERTIDAAAQLLNAKPHHF